MAESVETNMSWKYDQNEIDGITPARGIDLLTAKGGIRPSPRLITIGGGTSEVMKEIISKLSGF